MLMDSSYTSRYLRRRRGITFMNIAPWFCLFDLRPRFSTGVHVTDCPSESRFRSLRSRNWRSTGTDPMLILIGTNGLSMRRRKSSGERDSHRHSGLYATDLGDFEDAQFINLHKARLSGRLLWPLKVKLAIYSEDVSTTSFPPAAWLSTVPDGSIPHAASSCLF